LSYGRMNLQVPGVLVSMPSFVNSFFV